MKSSRVDGSQSGNVEPCVYTGGYQLADSMTQSDSRGRDGVPHRRFHQSVRRWGNSLALRLPAACLRQAGLREGDQVEIVVGDDGRLSLEPLHQLDRSALAMDLRRLQATMPLTPSVMEECRAAERW
jgi:antitoxin MazE